MANKITCTKLEVNILRTIVTGEELPRRGKHNRLRLSYLNALLSLENKKLISDPVLGKPIIINQEAVNQILNISPTVDIYCNKCDRITPTVKMECAVCGYYKD